MAEYSETRKMNDFDSATAPKSTRPGGLAWLRYPVYAASGMVGVFLLYRSLGLYQQAFAKWGLDGMGRACQPLSKTPLIGSLISGGCDQIALVVAGLVTTLVLLVLTTLQSLPTLLYFHPKAISSMVTQLRLNRKGRTLLAAESNDTDEIRTLIERHNHLSDRQLRTLLIFSVGAFALEWWIVWTARGGAASVGAALVDSLGFDVLIAATLAFAGIFRPTVSKSRRYGAS